MSEIERLLPDGVYLHLEEETYFAQDRLGSTDLTKLHTRGAGWWWASPYNPDYKPPPEDATSRIFGKALHALVLEGEDAYRERFAILPAKEELKAQHGDRFCVTVEEIKAQLLDRGFAPPGNKTKPWLIDYARSRAPDLVIWDAYVEDWERRNDGKLPVSAPEDRQLQVMREAILDHDEVGPLFRASPESRPLTEVSVLFTDEHGIRRRVRYDDLLPDSIVDMKAISAIGSQPLNFAVGDSLGRYGYHVQAADHQYARNWLMRFVREGKVHGGSAEERAWLARFPEEAAARAEYVWIFYQRPNATQGYAPIVFPWQEESGSQLHMDGIRARRRAIQAYLTNVARFGLDKPWTVVQPVHTTAEGYKHRVYVPHWVAEEHIPGEHEDL